MEFQSKERPQNFYKRTPFEKMTRYTERWRWIIKEINDYFGYKNKIPEFPEHLENWIRTMFEERLLPAFNQVDKKNRSHFPNYTYTIMKLLQYNDWQHKITHRHPHSWVKAFRWWCPIPSREKCKQLDETLWRKMCDIIGMKFLRTHVLQKRTLFRDETVILTNHMV